MCAGRDVRACVLATDHTKNGEIKREALREKERRIEREGREERVSQNERGGQVSIITHRHHPHHSATVAADRLHHRHAARLEEGARRPEVLHLLQCDALHTRPEALLQGVPSVISML
jgi:hypothetical protein